MGFADGFLLLVLAALWGASFLFIRVVSPVLGPVLLADVRVLMAAVALILYALTMRKRIQVLRKWKSYLILGAINAAIPFALISMAELRLSAALAAILNATTPLFTAVVARVWLGDSLSLRKIFGLVIGFAGVFVAVGGEGVANAHTPWLFALCSLGAALAYAFGSVFSARKFYGDPPLDLAIGQQFAAGLVLLPFSFWRPVEGSVNMTVIASVLGLSLLSTALAYLIYFRLMNRVGPVKTISVTFLVPIFGLLWGALFLGEALSWRLVLALGMILVSVLLVTNVLGRKVTRKPASDLPDQCGNFRSNELT